jgi:hypothetical protein
MYKVKVYEVYCIVTDEYLGSNWVCRTPGGKNIHGLTLQRSTVRAIEDAANAAYAFKRLGHLNLTLVYPETAIEIVWTYNTEIIIQED